VRVNQEQSTEWEQERLDFGKEICELKEHNERLTSELNTKSMTVDKLKNKVRLHLPRLHDESV